MIAKKGIRIANLRLIYSTAHLIYSAVKAFYATFKKNVKLVNSGNNSQDYLNLTEI